MSAARRLQIRVADLFGGAFRVWFGSFPQLLFIAALTHAPLIALRLVARGRPAHDAAREFVGRALPLLDLAAAAAIEACAVVLVLERLRGGRPDVMRSIRTGARRLVTVLGITAILNAPNGASAALDLFSTDAPESPFSLENAASWDSVLALATPDGAANWEPVAWTVAVGLFTFLVSVFLCGPVAVAVAERRGVIASIGRSWMLTRGFRLTIAFSYLLLSLAGFGAIAARHAIDLPVRGDAALLVDVAGDLLVATFACVVPIVIFHELREARESSGGEHLVEVFG